MARMAYAVIGAGYGDEGKGLMTDALAASIGGQALVVRTNGGAQAGHSVETPDGRRHVFHHVGSGALAGAGTHLARRFVHHPMLLGQEVEALARLGACTRISADPRGFVTTPWDMLVNQLAEKARGDGRHGSCGYGFGETVGRCEETGFALTLADLAAPNLRARLTEIRDEWALARLAELGVTDLSEEDRALLCSDDLLDRFLLDCEAHLDRVAIMPDAAIGAAEAVIFEGAQGLMLDQGAAGFPFVTRSNTGIANMLEAAGEAGIEGIEAFYMTRCYLTRHGRGAMPNEGDIAADFAVEDRTNVPNPWQETLRFGALDLATLRQAIRGDLRLAQGGAVRIAPRLAMTCLDQALGADVPLRIGEATVRLSTGALAGTVASSIGIGAGPASYGPTRATLDLKARGWLSAVG